MNIYFSHKFTNLQKKDIQLEFSKKITKDEKIFLKLLFFKIVSDSTFLEKAEIRFEEILSIPEFSSINNFTSFLKLYQKNIYLFMYFLQTLNFQVLSESFLLLFYMMTIVRYFSLKNLKAVSHWKRVFFLYLRLKNLFSWQIPFHLAFTIISLKMPKIKMKSVFHFHQ